MRAVVAEIRDVAPGLWLWRLDYPDWRPGVGWGPTVASVCVESGGEAALLDPLAPPAPRGELLVWATGWHEERVLPALRALLELPFEVVVVSHGEPVHDRAAFERALELPPWRG